MPDQSITPVNGTAAPAPFQGFIKLSRASVVDDLLRYPFSFALATQIARRARWREGGLNVHGLNIGEALVGDYKSLGMTERAYRTAKSLLEKCGVATFRPTNKGTIAKLCDASIYDINAGLSDEQSDRTTTGKRRTSDEQSDRPATTNEEGKEVKKGKQEKKPTPPRAAEEELKFPDGLDVEEFRTSFTEWMNFRRGLPGKVKNWSAVFAKQLAWLAPFGPNVAREILDQSLRNGWKGVFPLKQNNTNNRNNHAPNRQHHAPAPAAGSEW